MIAALNNPTLDSWLGAAARQLKQAGIPSGKLDAELLAEFTLGQSRTWLHAHPKYTLTKEEVRNLRGLLKRRLGQEPLAYIFGYKEFYGRDFTVTPDTLVPRPESEEFIGLIKKLPPRLFFIDIGTGSGILAITATLEQPSWSGTATDASPAAIKVAQLNAENLGVQNLVFKTQDLLTNDTQPYDIVLANLPYVPQKLYGKADLVHEPDMALFAEHGGLAMYEKLFKQIGARPHKPTHILTESLLEQHTHLEQLAYYAGYQLSETQGLIQHFARTTAQP